MSAERGLSGAAVSGPAAVVPRGHGAGMDAEGVGEAGEGQHAQDLPLRCGQEQVASAAGRARARTRAATPLESMKSRPARSAMRTWFRAAAAVGLGGYGGGVGDVKFPAQRDDGRAAACRGGEIHAEHGAPSCISSKAGS